MDYTFGGPTYRDAAMYDAYLVRQSVVQIATKADIITWTNIVVADHGTNAVGIKVEQAAQELNYRLYLLHLAAASVKIPTTAIEQFFAAHFGGLPDRPKLRESNPAL